MLDLTTELTPICYGITRHAVQRAACRSSYVRDFGRVEAQASAGRIAVVLCPRCFRFWRVNRGYGITEPRV